MSFRFRLVLFALAYWAGAELSYLLLLKTDNFVAFWPPAGLYLAMLLATPQRHWWAVVLTASVPNFLSDVVIHHQTLPVSLSLLLINLGASLVGAALVVRLCRPSFSFAHLPHVLRWSAIVSLVSTPLSALGGATLFLSTNGEEFAPKMLFWWLGDLLGVLLVTPLAYGVLTERQWPRRAQAVEAAALLLSLSAATALVFRAPGNLALPSVVLFFFLLWAALRFDTATVAAAATVLAVIAIWLTEAGFGPFSFQATPPARLLMAQLLVITGALLFYILAAAMAERRAAEGTLRNVNVELEQQVQARTAKLGVANEQLRSSQERLQLGVKVAEFAICEIDYMNGTNLLSPEAARLYGLGDGEMTVPREAVHATFHPDDAAELAPIIAESLNPDGDGHFALEHRVVLKNGEVRWLKVRKQIFFDRTQNPPRPSHGILAAQEITKRKEAEEKLRVSEERYYLAEAATNDGLWDWEPRTGYDYLSPQWKALLGFADDELPNHQDSFFTRIHPDNIAMAQEAVRLHFEQNRPFAIELLLRHKDGGYRWFLSRGQAVRNEAGEVVRMVGSISDITERKQAEEELRESEERFRAIFDSIDEGFCIVELIFDENNKPIDYCFVQANPAMERLTGLKDALGKTARELVPDLEEFWFETYGKVALTGESVRFENEAESMNRWFDVYASRIGGSSSHRVAIVFNNITERKEMEVRREQLLQKEHQAREAAEAATRAKDEFLAIVSHELRNPLNSILGYARLLRTMSPEAIDAAQIKKTVDIIERSGQAQLELINDLLDTARIISGKLKLEIVPLDLSLLINDAIEVMRPAADAKNISLLHKSDPGVGQIVGDPQRLQQIIWNLINNAVKFTQSGGLINVTLHRAGADLIIQVRDNGKGISPDFLLQIFGRFTQADASATRRHGGLGLGLSLVKQLVELHGGEISAESEGEGKGTTFTIKLPVQSTYNFVEEACRSRTLSESDRQMFAGLSILVIDDDYEARELMTNYCTITAPM